MFVYNMCKCIKINFVCLLLLLHSRGGGGNLPWIWVRMCGWSPQTPPHSYTRQSEKMTHSYTSHIENLPHSYTNFQILSKIDPIHILFFIFYLFIYFLGEKDTPLIYFWCEKMIPIHILGGLKSIPHSSRTSVYTFIMEVTHPPPWLHLLIGF